MPGYSIGTDLAAVRAIIASALPAYTVTQPTTPYNGVPFVTGNTTYVLTANANGALAAQDGVTLAVGDTVLLAAGAALVDNGLYTVTSIGSASTPYVLTSRFQNYATGIVYSGQEVKADTAGTTWGGSTWKLMTSGAITVGVSNQQWYPKVQRGTGATGGGTTVALTTLWAFAATSTMTANDVTGANAVQCGAIVAGAGTGTCTLTGTTAHTLSWMLTNS